MGFRVERLLFEAFRSLSEDPHADDDGHGDGDDAHGSGGEEGGHEEHSEFGVHITYEDLYDTVLFLIVVYMAGQVASRALKMPALVGEIVAGILMGPPLADFVPNPEAWVLLGEIGLILLVIEAGIDIDVSTLNLIGTRGFLIAVIGSILPIAFGIILAIAMFGTDDIKAAIAAGATFGPTSLGIALNILRSGGILNTPVGQLIVSAAVIDDMIALIVLSQLESLTGEITVAGVLIPVVSAVLFLVIGGYIALFIMPGAVEKYVLAKTNPEHHGKIEMAIMFGLVIAMMPATYYAKASYLMGCFVSGLAFCTSHELHETFVRQFKRVLQWLMRVFFSASIGFQVPIKDFADGTVIWQGLVFCAALTGKILVGLLVPNFTNSPNFTGMHLRDCLLTGFSMAAEGEFAFVIAVYSVDNGLVNKDLYASVVLAVLLSTIIPPFLLRFTISYYHKRAQDEIDNLAKEEMERNHDLEAEVATVTTGSNEDAHQAALVKEIQKKRAVFFCIQTQSESKWGLLLKVMSTMGKLGLDVIDHRSWHPRGINSTLINEVYVKDSLKIENKGSSQEVLDARLKEIKEALKATIAQPNTSKVRVQRWYPGVVEEIIESVHEKSHAPGKTKLNIEERLLKEAAMQLDQKQNMQFNATKEKSVDEILAEMTAKSTKNQLPDVEAGTAETADGANAEGEKPKPRRRRRQKMRSTPVVGGDMFGEMSERSTVNDLDEKTPGEKVEKGGGSSWKPNFNTGRQKGTPAEIIIDGETYSVRVNEQTLKALRTGFSGDMLDSRGVAISGGLNIQPHQTNVVTQLHGYVRSNLSSLGKIVEDDVSDTSSMPGADLKPKSGPTQRDDDGTEQMA